MIQVITGVEFNCQQPRRALHHVRHLIQVCYFL